MILVRIVAAIFALCMPALAHAQGEPTLSPRYIKGIGTAIVEPYWMALIGRITCTDSDNIRQLVKWPIRDRVLFVVGATHPGSPAQRAGFRCGDVIDAIDGQELREFAQMRSALQADQRLFLVEYRRPETVFHDPDGVTHVTAWEHRLALLDTMQIDLLAEMQKHEPDGIRQSFAYDDAHGPKLGITITSTVHELNADVLKYECRIAYAGEDEILHIESLIFPLFGVPFEQPTIKNGSSFMIDGASSIRLDGMPTKVEIPVFIARRIAHGRHADYIKQYGGSVGVIGTGRRDDWYAWQRERISCYVPQAFAHRVERMIKRHGRIGLR